MWSITHIIFYFLLSHAQTAMNSDWHDVGWGTSTDVMPTEAPQQTSSHKFRLTLRWLGHLDWRDVNQGTSTHIHVERYRWLRAIHHSKNTASVYICSCVFSMWKNTHMTSIIHFCKIQPWNQLPPAQNKRKRKQYGGPKIQRPHPTRNAQGVPTKYLLQNGNREMRQHTGIISMPG